MPCWPSWRRNTSPPRPTSVDAITGDARATGAPGGEIDRDPFDPSYWQMVPLPTARRRARRASRAPARRRRTPASRTRPPCRRARRSRRMQPPSRRGGAEAATPAEPACRRMRRAPAAAAKDAAAEPPRRAEAKADQAKTVAAATSPVDESPRTSRPSIAPMMAGKASPDLAVTATAEGVTINLTDDADYAMFPVGSAVPDPKTVVLLEHIAKVLAKQPGRDRRSRPHRRPAVPFGRLRQLAAFDGAGADGLLHAAARRPRPSRGSRQSRAMPTAP